MRITLAAIGRLKSGPDADLFARYWERLQAQGRKIGISSPRLIELPESRAGSVPERKSDEAQRLLKALGDSADLIALDETGRALTSQAFATHLGKLRDGGTSELAFAIGGPDGHGPALLQRAKFILNLGTLTLPHGLARIVIAEQLYRATTILSGHPYHRT